VTAMSHTLRRNTDAPADVALCLVSPDNASAQDRAVPPVRAGIIIMKSVTGKQIHSPTGPFYNRVGYC
jgi:hypothetical protein